jgi:hypothetical protein
VHGHCLCFTRTTAGIRIANPVMPDELAATLSAQEFVDRVEFLIAQK